MSDASVLLTVDQMYKADAAAVALGVPSLSLMEAAGTAIARTIRRRWRPRPVAVLCGPGNNGGDGFVVARLLSAEGWPVRLGLLGEKGLLRGDAAVNAERWRQPVHSLGLDLLEGDPLVVDGLFGAGLARPIEGVVARMIDTINERSLACIGVDVPSGVDGNTGAILGRAPACQVTVTFFRPKPGHLLLPGRDLCGDLVVADIGIPSSVLEAIGPQTFINQPDLWCSDIPWPTAAGNKYHRGHALIAGGRTMTGAARLAAEAARRIGAGLVTVAADPGVSAIYASGRPGTMVHPVPDGQAFAALIADERLNALLIGPGAGVSVETREQTLAWLGTGRAAVLDADALTVFRDEPRALFRAVRGSCLMTPHEGEFARLFPRSGDRLTGAREAADASGAVILLKGSDTVIAAPGGRAAITRGAPPFLATAGSGDVLAGLALGLVAQGMEVYAAACAAAWIHAACARAFGPGLIAEDLIDRVPSVLGTLRAPFNDHRRERPPRLEHPGPEAKI
jgi:NAD(P)H-hydrate epimerase